MQEVTKAFTLLLASGTPSEIFLPPPELLVARGPSALMRVSEKGVSMHRLRLLARPLI